jgi:hypothetical protein
MNLQTAYFYSEKLIALATFLQVVEFWQIRQRFQKARFHIWQTDSFFFLISLLVGFIGCLLMIQPGSWMGLLCLLFFALSMSRTFRGSFNGGSDSMFSLILVALLIGNIFRFSPVVQKACMLYLALQLVLSYFLSGLAKLRQAEWKNGAALSKILLAPYYSAPQKISGLTKNQKLMSVASWMILIFEFSFPLTLLNSKIALVYIVCGILFHLANVYIFGLNRFLFAWLASYPALIYASSLIASL